MAEGPGFESAFQQGEAWELSLSLRATWNSQPEGLGRLNALEEEGPWAPNPHGLGVPRPCPGEGGPGPAGAMQLWPTWGAPRGLLDHWWSEGHARSPRPRQAGFWPRFGCLSTARPLTMPVPSGRLRPSAHPASCPGSQDTACPDGLHLPLRPPPLPSFPGPPPRAGGKGPGSARVAYARGHPAPVGRGLSALAHAVMPGARGPEARWASSSTARPSSGP